VSFAVTRSKHPASELHASARVLSGGSIYVSDYPGQHDFDVRPASTSALLFCKMLVCLMLLCLLQAFRRCIAGPGSWCFAAACSDSGHLSIRCRRHRELPVTGWQRMLNSGCAGAEAPGAVPHASRPTWA